jgi:hypothetical protein
MKMHGEIVRILLEIKWYSSADDGNILGGSVHTIQRAEALVFARKETGLEVNADKTKYMVMFRYQKAKSKYTS